MVLSTSYAQNVDPVVRRENYEQAETTQVSKASRLVEVVNNNNDENTVPPGTNEEEVLSTTKLTCAHSDNNMVKLSPRLQVPKMNLEDRIKADSFSSESDSVPSADKKENNNLENSYNNNINETAQADKTEVR